MPGSRRSGGLAFAGCMEPLAGLLKGNRNALKHGGFTAETLAPPLTETSPQMGCQTRKPWLSTAVPPSPQPKPAHRA